MSTAQSGANAARPTSQTFSTTRTSTVRLRICCPVLLRASGVSRVRNEQTRQARRKTHGGCILEAEDATEEGAGDATDAGGEAGGPEPDPPPAAAAPGAPVQLLSISAALPPSETATCCVAARHARPRGGSARPASEADRVELGCGLGPPL